MITKLINDFLNFLNSLFSLALLLCFARLVLWYFFRFKLKLPRFRKMTFDKVGINIPKRQNKSDYELKKFKYETKLKYKNQYKLEKYKMKLKALESHKKSNKLASLPNYLRIVK